MAHTCSICGEQSDLIFTCTLCERTHCGKHRLPEKHECYGLNHVVQNFSGYTPGEDTLTVYERDASSTEIETDTPSVAHGERSHAANEQLNQDLADRFETVSDLVNGPAEVEPEDFVTEAETDTTANIEFETYRTTEPGFEKGPDVAADGSMATQEPVAVEGDTSDQGLIRRMLSFFVD